MLLEEEDLGGSGELKIKKLNFNMLSKKCRNASISLFYAFNRIINKKSISSVMNERYLLSNLRHP